MPGRSEAASAGRGLVRGLDPDGRRIYAVGRPPAGRREGELGALAATPRDPATPVWLSPSGRLIAEAAPQPGRSLRRMARRALGHADVQAEVPAAAEPAGWLVTDGPGTLPLYAALHPRTGDQLLTTAPAEAEQLGYEQTTLLGHLLESAPVTGQLGMATVDPVRAVRSDGRDIAAVDERVSVLIPTLNAGAGFERTLDAVFAQQGLGGLEVIVADSGSTDATAEVARRAGARVISVKAHDFNHGGTRNLLAAEARGEVLVTTVQDATLVEPTAVLELVRALRADPSLAAVSATTAAGEDADLFSRWHSWLHLQRPGGEARWAVDDVCAAIRRTAWERLRFRELDFGEDLDFGLRAHAAGWSTAFSARPLVVHHHDRPAGHALLRSAVHRQRVLDLGGDTASADAPGIAALTAALPPVAARLQSALDGATAAGADLRLTPCLRRVADALSLDLAPAEPRAEMAELAALGEGAAEAETATEALQRAVSDALAFPWLEPFARSRTEPVAAADASAFVARLAGSALGQALGDAMSRDPEAAATKRLRRRALNG